jgi:hypothetical protein
MKKLTLFIVAAFAIVLVSAGFVIKESNKASEKAEVAAVNQNSAKAGYIETNSASWN